MGLQTTRQEDAEGNTCDEEECSEDDDARAHCGFIVASTVGLSCTTGCYGTIRPQMALIQATRLRKGMLIKMNADLLRVLDVNHLTPGKGHGFVQARLRNIRTSSLNDRKFRSEESLERAILDSRKMQFLYADGDAFHFMDTESFEQTHLTRETLGDAVNYLLPDAVITVQFFESDPVGLELPLTVDLVVEDTTPAIKGATASAQLKPATLETGLVVQVPPFVAIGDTVRVNTETGQYQGRA